MRDGRGYVTEPFYFLRNGGGDVTGWLRVEGEKAPRVGGAIVVDRQSL